MPFARVLGGDEFFPSRFSQLSARLVKMKWRPKPKFDVFSCERAEGLRPLSRSIVSLTRRIESSVLTTDGQADGDQLRSQISVVR